MVWSGKIILRNIYFKIPVGCGVADAAAAAAAGAAGWSWATIGRMAAEKTRDGAYYQLAVPVANVRGDREHLTRTYTDSGCTCWDVPYRFRIVSSVMTRRVRVFPEGTATSTTYEVLRNECQCRHLLTLSFHRVT